jgi:hypothetical protein
MVVVVPWDILLLTSMSHMLVSTENLVRTVLYDMPNAKSIRNRCDLHMD